MSRLKGNFTPRTDVQPRAAITCEVARRNRSRIGVAEFKATPVAGEVGNAALATREWFRAILHLRNNNARGMIYLPPHRLVPWKS
ncbi:hypothetical protein [Falsiroseomonas sp. HW251]|uniref:hypothetical protein n=1 Tax=Falsiroseomonas sp. HW251 TaxID=3390998 RepID=UPI003D320188